MIAQPTPIMHSLHGFLRSKLDRTSGCTTPMTPTQRPLTMMSAAPRGSKNAGSVRSQSDTCGMHPHHAVIY